MFSVRRRSTEYSENRRKFDSVSAYTQRNQSKLAKLSNFPDDFCVYSCEKSNGYSEIRRKSIQFLHTQRNQFKLAELRFFLMTLSSL